MQTFGSSGAAGGGVLISGGDDKPIQAIQVMMLPAGTGEKEARAAYDDLLRRSGGRDLGSEDNPKGDPWALRSAVVNIRQPSPPAWEFSSFYLVPHGDRYFILRLGSTGEAADGMAAITSVFLHSWRWTDDGAPLDPRDHAGMRRLQGVGWSFEYPDSWDAAGVEDSQSGYVQESASGQTVNFSFKTATAREVEVYVNAEIRRKLGVSECDQSMASELSKQERDGVTVYRYAIRSHCGDMADGVLHNAVFFDGRTMVELRDGGNVPDSIFEDIVASFRFGW
ncbi:MAG: hypothetical protein IMW98_07580 [Firmicutes bacterium]|nr:hypothetical protein [Bacillota bacterium]